MSIQTSQNVERSPVQEKEVVSYLRQHPDFFERNTMLLAELSVPHVSGSAVSLVERQVAVLRDKNEHLQKQLDDFLQIAADNEKLSRQVYRFTLDLIQVQAANQLAEMLQHSMRKDFLADDVNLLILDEQLADISSCTRVDSRQFRAQFAKLLEDGGAMVGRFNDRQREFLFKGRAEKIASMALLPLVAKRPVGVLAIGSYDATRFYAGMGTVYLNQMSSLIGKTLARFARK
ncbi:MAG: DUF484 family protein [Gammaproteobacteria bacterium]|nr:DUF484 family protein [Gammaproteobacteria bacterium]MDH5800285.1 DUF484 family protein [Gammaproteobacteria bacterium]